MGGWPAATDSTRILSHRSSGGRQGNGRGRSFSDRQFCMASIGAALIGERRPIRILGAENCPRPASFPQVDDLRVEHRSFHAGAAIVPVALSVTHSRHATEADTDAACHGRFQRDLAGNAQLACRGGRGLQHGLRTAADDPRRQVRRGYGLANQAGHQAATARRPVVGAQPHLDPGAAEIVDAG